MVKSFLASILVSSALAINPGPFPLGPEGSGYGCDRACNAGDKNYVIKAKIETYNMKNSGKVTLPQKLSPDGNDIAIKTRTFVGDSSRSDPFCQNGYNGTSGVLAPCLTVNPGETINILVVNEIGNGMAEFNQVPADRKQFFGLIDSIPAGILPGPRAASFEDLNIVSEENMPGLDVSFDTTNIHLHGLHIIPHMFYPLGTADPDADWITIMVRRRDGAADTLLDHYVLNPLSPFYYSLHSQRRKTQADNASAMSLNCQKIILKARTFGIFIAMDRRQCKAGKACLDTFSWVTRTARVLPLKSLHHTIFDGNPWLFGKCLPTLPTYSQRASTIRHLLLDNTLRHICTRIIQRSNSSSIL
jgi:hypothetical protein